MSEIREQLAAALEGVPFLGPLDRTRVLDALLPLVVGYGNQRAAEALESAAEGVGDWPGVRTTIRSMLLDRADDLASEQPR